MSSPVVRSITDDELGSWTNTVRSAMLSPPASPEDTEARREFVALDRCLAAFDANGAMAGVARSFPTQLSVPGGSVAGAAVTAIGVLATHRRQGHLGRMMRSQLDDAAGRGEVVAVLIAAEYPIYGRFGYGPATEACSVRVDGLTAAWRDERTGSIAVVGAEEWAKTVADVYERAHTRNAGHITWDTPYWELAAGVRSWPDGEDDARRNTTKLVWRDARGHVQGAAAYSASDKWDRNRPRGELRLDHLVAASDEAEREIYRHVASVDWIATVTAGLRPVDEPLPLWLTDGRAATLEDHYDHVWLRVLDVEASLTGRTYAMPGSLVIEVVDPAGFAAGTYALETSDSEVSCTPGHRDPDLVVPVQALGAAYLGGVTFARLAAAGWVEECHDGAVARASVLFSTPRAPWCAMTF